MLVEIESIKHESSRGSGTRVAPLELCNLGVSATNISLLTELLFDEASVALRSPRCVTIRTLELVKA